MCHGRNQFYRRFQVQVHVLFAACLILTILLIESLNHCQFINSSSITKCPRVRAKLPSSLPERSRLAFSATVSTLTICAETRRRSVKVFVSIEENGVTSCVGWDWGDRYGVLCPVPLRRRQSLD